MEILVAEVFVMAYRLTGQQSLLVVDQRHSPLDRIFEVVDWTTIKARLAVSRSSNQGELATP